MTGTYLHNMDAKGRLFVPANFREELGACFYVAVGANREADGKLYQYLNLYPMKEWDRLCQKLAELPSSKAAVSMELSILLQTELLSLQHCLIIKIVLLLIYYHIFFYLLLPLKLL